MEVQLQASRRSESVAATSLVVAALLAEGIDVGHVALNLLGVEKPAWQPLIRR
ncbi:MAG: hypothetical protein PHE98_07375 [Thauera propionica]|jgi:hypothetical protein|nr:hypothetical protein [Thauera propionica]